MEAEQNTQGKEAGGYSTLDDRKPAETSSGTAAAFHDMGQELRDTIQFLAIQNMHMYNGKRSVENKLSQVSLEMKRACGAVEHEGSLINTIRSYAAKHNVQILVSGKPVGIDTLLGLGSQPKVFVNNQIHTSTQTERICEEYDCRIIADVIASNHTGATSSNNENRLPECISNKSVELDVGTDVDHDEDRETRNRIDMETFKEDLKNKREERHKAISAKSSEMERLRGELHKEKLAIKLMEKELENVRDRLNVSGQDGGQELVSQEINRLTKELSIANLNKIEMLTESKNLKDKIESLSNTLKEENLKYEQDAEYAKRRNDALKDVAALSKQMLTIRESQVLDLKERLRLINDTPKENSTTEQLKVEIDRQQNEITSLKTNHEEHLQKINEEKETIIKKLEEKTDESSEYEKKYTDLQNKYDELHVTASEAEELNKSLQTRLDLSVDESKGLSKEISLINSIFTQMLVGNSSTALDLDKLTRLLQENHDLITEMTTNEDSSETAASLPKLLLDLVNQIDSGENAASTSDLNEASTDDDNIMEHKASDDSKILAAGTTTEKYKVIQEDGSNNILAVEEIASNLPKVWRVLMELLSHHIAPTPTDNSKSSCYKRIDTPSGPKLVPSVSNTYIRLKDLILEKKSLQRDLGKLKQLNGHLESKLHEQETRLSLVSAELQKTWGVVGRLRSQFRQLRTHEQILRYELQQKRNLLTELKTELEYCREKWERARQKDLETAEECQKLRKEFAARKLQDRHNSSSESGFSEGKDIESGDDEKSGSKLLVAFTSSNDMQPLPENQDTSTALDTTDSTMNAVSKDDSSISTTTTSLVNDASDVSHPRSETHPYTKTIWMSLLKLHFMFSPQNRAPQFEHNHSDDMKSLDSIFSLQPIVIPELILQQLKDQKHVSIEAGSPNNEEQTKESKTQKSKAPPNSCNEPCPSTSGSSSRADGKTRDALGRTPEEALAARAARLQRLEEQTQMLFKKVTRTTNRSVALCTRLEELHEQYGVPNPPPLPQVLPVLRIPVSENLVQDSSMSSTTNPQTSTNDLSTHVNDNEEK